MLHRRCPHSTRCIFVGKKHKKNLWIELDRFSWFLFFICVFRLPQTTPKISPLQPTQPFHCHPKPPVPSSPPLWRVFSGAPDVAVERHGRSVTPNCPPRPPMEAGIQRVELTEPWRKEPKKKGLEFLFWGGCWLLWEVFCWWGEIFWGEDVIYVICWLVDLTVTHFDSDFDGTTSYLPLRYAWWNCPLWKPRTNQALSLQVGRDLGCFWVAQMLKRCSTHVGSNDRGQICNIEIYSPEN